MSQFDPFSYSDDVSGVIKLDEDTERQSSSYAAPSFNDAPTKDVLEKAFDTLDEPISDTIKRDVDRIYSKLRIVINPF